MTASDVRKLATECIVGEDWPNELTSTQKGLVLLLTDFGLLLLNRYLEQIEKGER